ncbi:hypothetical protein HOU35_gp037 [Acinetobacter phage vB_AbaM_B09_Aci05]|uniref:Uncharacterized protein n=1 Tax=Acinetobacter phage vB_AbaM_B09_Aci05 TaxID=2315458 RepID=A0A386KAF7_9CAUD|nr:hypothetical protein HOU35_gp037 [Acinetobacter phage vB_AbaM_B09_Aci05]AYD82368.1 hypothetical protein Aci05_140 [Acinetobacter phage vB_AbaM_B09_Aci05]
MSHFGIDPRVAKDFWSTDPVKVTQEILERKHIAICEKFHRDMMLHDAYYFGLFPSAEDVSNKEYLDAFAEIQRIARRHSVDFIQPRKMPDVGTIGYPEEPCLNELTRLIRGGIAKDEVCVVVGKPTNASAVRPEVLEFYKSRRSSNPVLHVALEDTKPYLVERYLGTSIK